MTSRWTPHVTVAAVVERDGELLMVEERIDGRDVLNQPAGHLDAGESLVDAVVREVLEETRWVVEVTDLVGVHRWRDPTTDRTWLRFVFAACPIRHEPDRPLDPPVISVHWMTPESIQAASSRLRSPLVAAALDDYSSGQRSALSLLRDLEPTGDRGGDV